MVCGPWYWLEIAHRKNVKKMPSIESQLQIKMKQETNSVTHKPFNWTIKRFKRLKCAVEDAKDK